MLRCDGVTVRSSKPVAEALQQWADKYRFLDPWLQDAGIQTMYRWFLGENAGKWRYFPEELEIPRLQLPNFGYWIPSYSSWTEFKRIIESMVRLKLLEYRATVSTLWGQQKPKLPEHAAWTVRWQLGKSPEGIRNWHRHMTGETNLDDQCSTGRSRLRRVGWYNASEAKSWPSDKENISCTGAIGAYI